MRVAMNPSQFPLQGESAVLVSRAQGGDTLALQGLIERHLPALRAYVRLRCGPGLRARESVSDIVQSACRDALGDLSRFQYGGEAGFRAWLFTAAMRKIADRAEYWRAQRRNPAREQPMALMGDGLPAIYASLPSPSAAAMGLEAMERLEQAFDQLPEDDREVIVLSRVVGLSHTELAEQLGIGVGACRMRLFRALAALSEALGEGGAPAAE